MRRTTAQSAVGGSKNRLATAYRSSYRCCPASSSPGVAAAGAPVSACSVVAVWFRLPNRGSRAFARGLLGNLLLHPELAFASSCRCTAGSAYMASCCLLRLSARRGFVSSAYICLAASCVMKNLGPANISLGRPKPIPPRPPIQTCGGCVGMPREFLPAMAGSSVPSARGLGM